MEGAYRLYLSSFAATGAVKTAMPAESGPRSVMPINIGIINPPILARMLWFFTSNPTIPHIVFLLMLNYKNFRKIPERFDSKARKTEETGVYFCVNEDFRGLSQRR